MPRQSPFFVLHTDPALLSSAEEARESVVRCADWHALVRALRVAPPTAQVLVDPYLGGGGTLSPGLRELLAVLPSVSVVAALELHPARMRDVATLQEWGVAEIAALPAECGARALVHILERSRGRAFLRAVRAALPLYLSGRGTATLLVAAQAAHAWRGPRSLGRALGESPAVLVRSCAREGLPHPVRLMRWMRALTVAQLLDDPARTPAMVAHACGYDGREAMSAALRRLGPGFAEPAAGQAFGAVMEAFRAEMLGLREAARGHRRDGRTPLRNPHGRRS